MQIKTIKNANFLEFFVIKKNTDPNKITSLLLATLLLMQNREGSLVLSGQERTKLYMRELRSFLGCYDYREALIVGLLPYMNYRLLMPVLSTSAWDDIIYGLPGTLKTYPHYKPKRAKRSGTYIK